MSDIISPVRFLSVCAGIEAASEAVKPLGWQAVAFSEIDRAASRVLAHHHRDVPNLGDFTSINPRALGPLDVLFGGTPCQAFSVAGLRMSLSDARGNLTLAFAVLAHELVGHAGLRNAVWENVPGVLNTPDNAFGCFLAALVGADAPLCPPGDGGWPRVGMVAGPRARAAWRVFDAQYFGLAQRRARVWLVVDFGDGADPASVLFERQGLRRYPPARGEAGEGVAGTLNARTHGGGGLRTDFECDGGLVPLAFGGGNRSGDVKVAATLTARGHKCDFEVETFITHALTGEGFDASEDGTGRGTPLVPVQVFYSTESRCDNIPPEGLSPPLKIGSNGGGQPPAIAYSCKDAGADATEDLSPTLRAMVHAGSHANAGGQMAVAFDLRGREGGSQFEGPHDTANIRAASGGSSRSYVATSWAVRRLTPRECERLQGFPDDHTRVPDAKGKPQADGPRYRQIGNSWPVPVAAWICARIDAQLQMRGAA